MSLEMKYFVLKPRGTDDFATASRAAMETYADVIEAVDPMFAKKLRIWVGREQQMADLVTKETDDAD